MHRARLSERPAGSVHLHLRDCRIIGLCSCATLDREEVRGSPRTQNLCTRLKWTRQRLSGTVVTIF